MRNYIKKFLKFIDIFRIPGKATIKEEENIKNVLGGSVSLLFFIVVIGFAVYHIKDFDKEKKY